MTLIAVRSLEKLITSQLVHRSFVGSIKEKMTIKPLLMRPFFLALLFIGSAFSLSAQSGRVQQTPTPTPTPDETLRVTTEEIKLNVLAFDTNGKFVKDVSAN